MPLPKPPATRAALLSAADYESQSAPKPNRRTQKTQAQADPTPKLLDLRDDHAETGVARLNPAARAPVDRTPGIPVGPAPVISVATGSGRQIHAKHGARKRARADGPSRLFVLDTNVLLHDPTSLFRFEEHDV